MINGDIMKRNRLAGHTMIEVMVSVMLMGLITTSVISGLIIFSRSEKALSLIHI